MVKDKKIPVVRKSETLEFWQGQIEAAKKYLEDFMIRGDKVECRYKDDERDQSQRNLYGGNFQSSYNILYSNTETILPILFSETPEPDVRANDLSSPNARLAAKIMEDVISYNGKLPETVDAIACAVKDLLLPGMGCIRVMYKPTFEKRESVDFDENGDEVIEREERLVFEEICYKHVHWRDLIYPKFKEWSDLPWLAFCGLYTYNDALEEFGATIANKLEYGYIDPKNKDLFTGKPVDDKFGLAKVYEIWDKTNRKVVWIAEGGTVHEPLRIDDDPLELDEFFPIAKPLFAVTTTGDIKPKPFFVQYQDLANELDDISTRLRRAVDNLRRRGVFDSSFSELQQLSTAEDNQFIPVRDFSKLQAKGGIKGVMDFEDLTAQLAVVQSLYQQRAEVIQAIYQIMGYSDILRGQTDPRETLGAQRIKGRFGTLRISHFQREVQRIIRDSFRIAGQVIANKFEARTIALMTNVPLEKVVVYQEILKATEPASVMIDIQTDSTIAADDIADKEDIVQFIKAINGFVERAPVMSQTLGIKATSDLLMSLLKKFKMGRDIELAVMDRVNELLAQEKAAKQQPPQPSAEEQKMALEASKMQANLAIEQAKLQVKNRELDIRAAEIGLKDTNAKQELDLKAVDIALKQIALAAENANPEDNAIVGV